MNTSYPRLRIAVVAPPWFEIPPLGYGGIEWLCHWLVEGLIDSGNQVTLVASGSSPTRAEFLQTYRDPPSVRLGDPLPELLHAAIVDRELSDRDFDVIHDHSFAGPLLAGARRAPTLVTAHGPVDGELAHYYARLHPRVRLVAISEAQRRWAPELPWIATVHNSIPVADYPYAPEKERFVLFLGRMSPEKGAHLAIEAARDAGFPLVLAGKINESKEHAYFEAEVRPRLGPDIEWIGPANTELKKDLLRRARCLVFPIRWEEPFGIVMAEAMACGTPVVALNRGSVSEVVEHDETGFICERPADLPEAIKRAELIEPAACRRRAERYFDVGAMVAKYEAVYREVAAAS
ncbi:MAG TPA: glycosyltransferase family 4 protein [Actinomycetota bacterium]|nr:glycosyltransferase family 4 protein [Actinomycetota bacterium]